MPFVISAMQQGKPFKIPALTPNHPDTVDTTEASMVTGTLLAMFFIAFAIASPVFGYICMITKTYIHYVFVVVDGMEF